MEKHDVHEGVSKIVKEYRSRKGWSQDELATRMSVYQSVVARIETGHRRLDLPMLFKVAEALDIPWEEFNFRSKSEKKETHRL